MRNWNLHNIARSLRCALAVERQQIFQMYRRCYANRYCCDRKSRAAYAQSFAPWQQATIEISRRDHSVVACSRHTHIFVLRAHPVRGESHNQRNTTGEVATICFKKKQVWGEQHAKNMYDVHANSIPKVSEMRGS